MLCKEGNTSPNLSSSLLSPVAALLTICDPGRRGGVVALPGRPGTTGAGAGGEHRLATVDLVYCGGGSVELRVFPGKNTPVDLLFLTVSPGKGL